METGFPFTNAQWKELERQAVIYKYMAARMPVPVHLLSPFATSSSNLESVRCRRTDGKKWRCSRDAAPNQKYCERHINRGRPRSRKHVEQQQQQSTIPATNHKKPRHHQPSSSFPSPSFYPHLQPRNLEWVMRTEQQQEEEEAQQWLHLINPAQHEEQTYLNLATDNTTPLFLNFDPNPSQDEQISRSFIDAWSQTKTTVNDDLIEGIEVGDLCPSSLSLGMGNWFNSVSASSCSSWVSPLAEVLRQATGLCGGSGETPTAMVSLSDSSNSSSPTKTKPEFALY